MISRMKLLPAAVLFAVLPLLYASEIIFLPENALLFKEEPDKRNWDIKANVQKSFFCEVTKKEKAFLPKGAGIGIFVDVCRLNIPGFDDTLSYFPEVTFKKGKDGVIQPYVDKADPLMFLGVFFFAVGAAAAAGYFRSRPDKKKYLLPASLLFFFLGYAFWHTGFMANAVISPADEVHYYIIAAKLLSGDLASMKFHYTIGFPVLCIPFVVLFRVQNWLEFIPVYMNFQTFVLIPALLLVLYWFFQAKMGLSRLQSYSLLLLWLVLTVFYMPMYGTGDSVSRPVAESFYANGCFRLFEQNLFFVFIQLTWLGRNAMSDHMSAFLFVVLLAFSMKKSRSLIRFFLLSAGFGFLCLVRMNYIFFAPLLAFVFYDSFSGLWQKKRNYLYAFFCGTAGFLAGFVWQFIVNKIQLGSPFIWPYSLHKFSPDRGFVWSMVPYGFKCLCQANYVYLIPAVSSWFFIPDRKTRVLLMLWIFPTLFFFCGAEWNSPLTASGAVELSQAGSSVPIIFNNPIRFIFALYPPLLAALVMNPVWKAVWSVRIKAALVVVSSCLLCKSNIFFTYFQPWGLEKAGWPNTVFIITQCAVCLFCCAVIFSMRKELEADHAGTVLHFRFLILFTAVFFLGSACIYLTALLFLAAFVYGLRDTWSEIRALNGEVDRSQPAYP